MANHANLIRQENFDKPVTRRGRRFIEFDLGGGRYQYVATIDPLHKRGSEVEIDTAFVPDTGAWQWKLASADFEVHTRDVFNSGALVEWRHQSGEWIIVDPQSINWINEVNARQQIAIKQAVSAHFHPEDDNLIHWGSAYGPGRHFEFTAHPRRLIKNFVIDNLTDLPTPTVTGTIHFEAEFTLSTSTGVDFWLDGVKWAKTNGVRVRTANRIEFRNTANTETLWYADAPTATDANGETVNCEYEVRRQGGPGNLFITVRVPREWLLTAAYPVQIDPTFTDGYGGDTATAKDEYVRDGFPTRNYGVTTLWSAISPRKALLEFDGSEISDTATCISATFYAYQGSTSSNNATVTVYSIASGNAAWIEGTKNNATAGAGEPCWDALAADGSGGVTTAWAGSAGLATSGTDYEASSIGSFSIADLDGEGTEYSTLLTASRVEAWFGGSNTNYGILLVTDLTAGSLCLSDHATTGYRPKLVVVYETGGSVTAVVATAVAAGVAPSLSAAVNITSATATASAIGISPFISVAVSITGVVATANAAGISPSLSSDVNMTSTVADATAAIIAPTITGTEPTQKKYPVSDTSIGNWTTNTGATTNLFDALNETTYSDTDFIKSEESPSSSPCVVKLDNLADPESSTGHILRYRYGKEGQQNINITVQLRQGYTNEASPGTLIKEWVHTNVGALTTAEQTLDGTEADSITDYASLFVRMVGSTA